MCLAERYHSGVNLIIMDEHITPRNKILQSALFSCREQTGQIRTDKAAK